MSALGQTASKRQSSCEKQLLRDSQAVEIFQGPEYNIFLEVSAAYGRLQPPRLYFVPGGNNAAYIAGSVSDGRGKIVMSVTFVQMMGSELALKGIMAHEMGHLILDILGKTACDDWMMRDPQAEKAADAIASQKVGLDAIRAFLSRVKDIVGRGDAELTSRLDALIVYDAPRGSGQ